MCAFEYVRVCARVWVITLKMDISKVYIKYILIYTTILKHVQSKNKSKHKKITHRKVVFRKL